MSDTSLTAKPTLLLRGAGTLLTSSGEVVKELTGNDTPAPLSPPPMRESNSLGASIKRRFRGFRERSKPALLKRSRSVDPRSPAKPATAVIDGIVSHPTHSKSLLDVTTVVNPLLLQSTGGPPFQKRHSALPALSSVSGYIRAQKVTSPVSEEPEVPQTPSSPAVGNIRVPQLLKQGTPMTKISMKRHKKLVFRLDADLGQIVWQSKKQKIIPIENIKEIRSGDDARSCREQFQLSQDYRDRWLTIIYIIDGKYKTLHLIPATKDVFWMWDKTLRELFALRQELMRGLGNGEIRERLWEKHYWKGADEEPDQKLVFEEVVKMCRRLNINSTRGDLLTWFKQADSQKRDYLDFDDFRRFVKLLKGRSDIDRLHKKLCAKHNGVFDFTAFQEFMVQEQRTTLSETEMLALFNKYSATNGASSIKEASDHGPTSSDTVVMNVDSFTAFLLSPDNSAFADQHTGIHQDMTRPLPEYYISSSHNTYLVGHQLVGESTVEGYVRALLHSCRSVELDIYDGDTEPMIFHGKTLTSKVSLREVCQTIMKYGFVASPYPIIISAEVHCSLPHQDMIAEIMTDVFGDHLIRMPVGEHSEVVTPLKIEHLPSPEDLRGKILLKTKNLHLLKAESMEGEPAFYTDTPTSADDSEVFTDGPDLAPKDQMRHGRSQSDSFVKEQLFKTRTTVLQRVRTVGKSSLPPRSIPQLILPQPPPEMVTTESAPQLLSTSPPLTPRKSLLLSPRHITDSERPPSPAKRKMSPALLALLVYTVGVKCRGLNKKEEYALEHMFSLSETAAGKMLKWSMSDLIKHAKTHLVRIYPKGTRVSSSNYEPHRFWAAGSQLVAINWQTFDLGYMINHAMFQRNGRSGYVLKPDAVRFAQKEMLAKRTTHSFDVTIVSAQQLPRPKDALGHEVIDRSIIDPYVEVTLYIPDWPAQPEKKTGMEMDVDGAAEALPTEVPPPTPTGPTSTPCRTVSSRTRSVRKNGFNPVWEESVKLRFDCIGDMMDLIFVRLAVRQEGKEAEEPLAVYCAPLGSLQHGYRHLPLHDSQLSQYLFSTLFVRIRINSVMTPASASAS